MDVLILSGKFGMGHNAAAHAIAQEIIEYNHNAIINKVDLPEYIFPNMSKYIYGVFNIVAEKYHSIYNLVNRFSEHGKMEITPPSKIFKKIKFLIEENKPDIIICTLPLCAQYISAYKKKTGCSIPLATCITDISTHNEWISTNTDIYFAPTKEIKNQLIKTGIPEPEIFVTGIPVKEEFKNSTIANSASKRKNVLIMGGGLGLLPDMKQLMSGLSHNEDLSITAITGNNKKAFRNLSVKYKNLEVVGCTNQVSTYMQKADLIITKPGGITMFESLYSNTPIVVLEPFLEQEIKNAIFIEQNKIGKVFWNNKQNNITEIQKLLYDKVEQQKIRNNMSALLSEITENNIGSIISQYLRKTA